MDRDGAKSLKEIGQEFWQRFQEDAKGEGITDVTAYRRGYCMGWMTGVEALRFLIMEKGLLWSEALQVCDYYERVLDGWRDQPNPTFSTHPSVYAGEVIYEDGGRMELPQKS